MQCLLEHLEYGGDRLLWLSSSDLPMTTGRFVQWVSAHWDQLVALQGKSVALDCDDFTVSAALLTALDGLVKSLLLMPPNIESEVKAGFLRQAEINTLISSNPGELTNMPQLTMIEAASFQGSVTGSSESLFAKSETQETTWILATSGTTNVPKLVHHTLRSLTRTVKPSDGLTQYRWGLLYDVRRFAGLQVFLQSLIGGGSLIVPSMQLSLRERLAFLVEHGCEYLSATPTLWRRILMTENSSSLILKQITLGGEIADQMVLSALRRQYPGARITHIFASTETGVGFSVHDELEGFPVAYTERHIGNIELRIDDESFLLMRIHENETKDRVAEPQWINTGDLVERRGERFIFRGRANGAINVGGNKVIPEEVEHVILQVPNVAACQVRARRSSLVGNLVEALVVPMQPPSEPAAFIRAIQQHCAQHLERYKIPAFVQLQSDLMANGSGKLQRKA